MGIQSARNYGVTGIIDLSGTGTDALMPIINAKIEGFQAALAVGAVDITGPGDDFANRIYGSNVSGSGSATGWIQSATRPYPPTMHNLQGNLIHQADTNCSITLPVLITSLTCSKVQNKQDRWQISITWSKNGKETIQWNGQAMDYPQPILTLKELFADTTKMVDPNGLTTMGVVKYFLPTPATDGGDASYSNAARYAAIDAFITENKDNPPREGLKISAGGVVFLPIDDAAGLLLVNWGLKDSLDDQEMPNNYVFIDPEDLTSAASVGKMDDKGVLPVYDKYPNYFTDRGTRSQDVVPGRGLNVTTGGLRTTAEDITMPGTWKTLDPCKFRTVGQVTEVFTTTDGEPADPTPPAGAGLKIVASRVSEENRIKSIKIWSMAMRTSAEDIERPGTWTVTDPYLFDSAGLVTKTYDIAAGEPADPPAPPTLQVVLTRVQQENDLKAIKTWHMGRMTSLQKHIAANTRSSRSGIEPWIDRVAQVISSVASDQDDADRLWATAQSFPNIMNMSVQAVDVDQKLIVYEYVNPGIIVSGISGGDGRLVEFKVDGNKVYLYVLANYQRSTSWRQILLDRPRKYNSPRRELVYQRFRTGVSIDDYVQPSLLGSTNSGSFDGLAAGSVYYRYCQFHTNKSLSGTRPFFLNYHLIVDPLGFVDDISPRLFMQPQDLQTNVTDTGWQLASDLGYDFKPVAQVDLSFINT
ncbi:MAG: hypothetical protein FWD61_12505 [Phycisphaerales bacterium]|nr:hypothetical protein [Phycisphaerales bacterium]